MRSYLLRSIGGYVLPTLLAGFLFGVAIVVLADWLAK